MNILEVVKNSKPVNFVKRNSPQILLGAGIVSFIGGAVYACIATLRVEKELKKEEPVPKNEKDILKAKTKKALMVVKEYAPAIVMECAGVACTLSSYNILKNRYLALGSAYASLGAAFLGYRKRVEDAYGKEEELRIYNGITVKDISDKDGNVIKDAEVIDEPVDSPYVRYITKTHPWWEGDDVDRDDYYAHELDIQQRLLNNLLDKKEFVTLNEAYVATGFTETKAGMVVGWTKGTGNGTDGYIQLTIKRVHMWNPDINDYEEAYAVDYNVDGNIYNELV